jgi:hypothetical protein
MATSTLTQDVPSRPMLRYRSPGKPASLELRSPAEPHSQGRPGSEEGRAQDGETERTAEL